MGDNKEAVMGIFAGRVVGGAGVVAAAVAVWLGGGPAALAAGWSIQRTPDPAHATGVALAAVSCTSARMCIAVGSFTTRRGRSEMLAERWNGTRWSIGRTPVPAHARGTSLAAVSCANARMCIAVGGLTNGHGAAVTLAERWNGTRWSIVPTPNPPNSFALGPASSSLRGVSCVSGTTCLAIGVTSFPPKEDVPVAERWNGRRWTLMHAAEGGQIVGGLSCVSRSFCAAVGTKVDATGFESVSVQRWDGRHWTVTAAPRPQSGPSSLNAVSCPRRTFCAAVGSQVAVSAQASLTMSWDGRGWMIQQPTSPTGPGDELNGVSCTSTMSCVAVGTSPATLGGHAETVLGERWSGASWSIEPVATPPARSGVLNAVSCPSAMFCAAVGTSAGGALAESS